MKDDNLVLRLLDNLLNEQVISVFFVVIMFLILEHALNKQIRKGIHKKWVARYCSAFFSTTILLALYFLMQFFIFLIHKYRFDVSNSSLFEGLSFYFILVYPFVVALTYCLYYFFKDWFTKTIKEINIRFIIEAIVALIIAYTPLVLILVIRAFFGNEYNLHGLPTIMANSAPNTFGAVLAVLVYNYFQYIDKFRSQQKELQITQLQQQLTQSQLDALSSKINPHFLYNSLNSIAGLSTENSTKTREMAIALSKLFRYNINRDESSYASIKDEVEMAVLYLEIEKIRFEERLEYSVSIQEGIEGVLMPRHLLQPIVENAVKHGAGPNGVEISIVVEKKDKMLVIKVGDKGEEFNIHFNPGYGIKSLYDKLDILVPNKYEITFLNNPKEVRIEIAGLK